MNPGRALDPVTAAKALALDFGFIQAAAKCKQFVAADGGLGAEIPDRLRGRLLNDRKALLEAQRSDAIVVGVQVVEIDRMRILLVGLDALDNLVLDIVEGLRVARGAVL